MDLPSVKPDSAMREQFTEAYKDVASAVKQSQEHKLHNSEQLLDDLLSEKV